MPRRKNPIVDVLHFFRTSTREVADLTLALIKLEMAQRPDAKTSSGSKKTKTTKTRTPKPSAEDSAVEQ